jgi:hypothetical protein
MGNGAPLDSCGITGDVLMADEPTSALVPRLRQCLTTSTEKLGGRNTRSFEFRRTIRCQKIPFGLYVVRNYNTMAIEESD